MNQRAFALIVSGTGALVTAPSVSGQVAYDALTGLSPTTFLSFGSTEVAEDTTLDPAAPLTISAITMAIRNGQAVERITGSVRMRVYADAAGLPGLLLAELTLPLDMAPATRIDQVFDFPDFAIPSRSLWTSYTFTTTTSPELYPSSVFTGPPTVGATGPGFEFWSQGAWRHGFGSSPNSLALRIDAVPAPAGLSLVLGIPVFTRRRR